MISLGTDGYFWPKRRLVTVSGSLGAGVLSPPDILSLSGPDSEIDPFSGVGPVLLGETPIVMLDSTENGVDLEGPSIPDVDPKPC